MIRIDNTEVYGWQAAIRGMRNPMNSWSKSDSTYDVHTRYDAMRNKQLINPVCDIGENDYELMKKLIKAGTDHSKFMRMITVYCDITAPMYYWKEFDTYKVGTVRNSCSTMHKIHSKEFTLDDFSIENIGNTEPIEDMVYWLNEYRTLFNETNDKQYWWDMIQLLPSSYNQKSTVMLNYQVLRNMYHSRKNHKLNEWRQFCEWVESLPYSELITGGEE